MYHPVEVRSAGAKGRGVFAVRDIEVGDLIERAPVIPMPSDAIDPINKTALSYYVFMWGEADWPGGEGYAVALGYISLYNHSYTPNARYTRDYDKTELVITALKPIKAGEEIVVNYNGVPDCMDALWFEVKS